MQHLSYPARLSPEPERAYTVTFRDLPEAITSGTDLDDALAQAADCLSCALAGRIKDRREIPRASRPRRGSGFHLIQVPLYLAPKVALYMAMRESNTNNSQLARKLGVTETVIRRMLNPHHDTKAEKLQAALEALGKRILVAVENAA